MISGAAQADVCLLMVPADGNFTTAIQKGDHKVRALWRQALVEPSALGANRCCTACLPSLHMAVQLNHQLTLLPRPPNPVNARRVRSRARPASTRACSTCWA